MANDNEIDAMRAELEQLRQAIASDVDAKLDAKFEASERRLRRDLTQDLTQELARQLETAQQHLVGCMQVHAEELKDLVKKGAEGYGGTLEGIQRELKDFRKEFRDRADHTDRILDNHAGRIVAIEQTLSKS